LQQERNNRPYGCPYFYLSNLPQSIARSGNLADSNGLFRWNALEKMMMAAEPTPLQ
jgi:hypothetical protein